MSINRIRGDGGVIIDSKSFLELPKAPSKETADVIRSGMIRYNKAWKSFEGVLDFEDGSMAYRRFANLDANGKLLTSQLPDSVTSGLQFVGTYNPIPDDIDPPLAQSPLPAPSSSLSGDYYVVRGIMDAAQAHFEANKPKTSPVTFTPTNPTGQGNWVEILYYVDSNPNISGAKLVTNAFARIISTSIPSTGHSGLVNLATDDDLTKPFASGVPMNQTALSDGDWIIITEDKNIRLRQSRTSISAASVLYDNTIMIANNRQFRTNAGTVQTSIDNVVIECLRRTGDSMYDDGTIGSGRFGVVYGSASAPAIAFNNKPFDPTSNPGNDPEKWSDTNTGIFHPADDAIGFSTAGTERVRINNSSLTLYQTTTTPALTPILHFDNPTNTNVGISASSNIISFSSMYSVQVEFKNGESDFHGNIVVDGTSRLIGDTSASNITASGNLNVQSNTILGDTAANTLVVNATSTFKSNTKFNSNIVVDGTSKLNGDTTATNITASGNLNVQSDTILGDNATNTLVVNATSTFNANTKLNGDTTATNITANGNLIVQRNTILGDAAENTIVVNGTSTFNANTNFNGNSNKFKNLSLLPNGIITLESPTNQSTMQLVDSDLKLSMGNYADVSIYDNGIIRTRFNRYGIQLPVLATIDNSVGVDGMIAYSNTERTSMQKVQGQWVPIGSGSVRTDAFTISSWVLSGNYYTLTVTASNIVTAEIQEQVSPGVYTRVEVDSVTFNGTNVVFSIPSTPDVRFDGRTLVTIR
ncbi:hypothetical protein UES1_518 [Escherichia phage UE-S1]|nr:hypothetical protein UES1_518 [Escherichia phage UE-S1]